MTRLGGGGDLEELAGPLAVVGGEDRGVDEEEATVPEELVDPKRGRTPHPQHRAHQVGPRPEMRDLAEELGGVLLLLERVLGLMEKV